MIAGIQIVEDLGFNVGNDGGLMKITVHIPGEPHPQGRARATVRAGRAVMYDPKKSSSWKMDAAWAMAAARGHDASPLGGALKLECVFAFSLPKSEHRKREPTPAHWHAKRPDIDNLLKAVMDAAKGVLWFDDTQVAQVICTKYTVAQGAAPGTTITVSYADEAGPEGVA